MSFIESLGRGRKYHFHYLGDEGEYAPCRAALLPILSAFRWMVYTDESTGRYAWRGGFESVKASSEKLGTPTLRQTRETSVQVGRKMNAMGRSRNHWETISSTVGMAYHLQSQVS